MMNNPHDASVVIQFQKSLCRYFSLKSGEGGEIPSDICSESKLISADVLYDELIGSRAFMVYVGDSDDIPLNAFVKLTAWDYEEESFGVSVSIREEVIPYIWTLYSEWMSIAYGGGKLLKKD